MPRGGSKQGERRGGRKPGTPNKLPKGTKALVKLEEAEAQVRVLKAENRLETLGKARLTELDAWAYSMAQQFAPKTNAKTGRMEWEGEGDEARFMRFMKLCGEGAAGIRRAALLAQIGEGERKGGRHAKALRDTQDRERGQVGRDRKQRGRDRQQSEADQDAESAVDVLAEHGNDQPRDRHAHR